MQSVQKMIGPGSYAQNRLILSTVFSQRERFYKDGRINYLKVSQVLKRLGFIPESFKSAANQSILFHSFVSSPLFLRLGMGAMEGGGAFDYGFDRLQRDEDGMVIGFVYRSSHAFDLPGALKFLENRGAKVLGVERVGSGWRLFCDPSQALLVPRGALSKERVDEPLWFNVSRMEAIQIHSHPKNHWHPLIAMYDRDLRPLGLIDMSEQKRSLRLSLPKGCYYIKISDKYTIKNIKYGLRIQGIKG